MSGKHRAAGRRINVLATAAAIVATEIVLAAGVGGAYAMATARATPTCDQTDVSLCRWTVEINSPNGVPFDVELPGCVNEDGNTDGQPCLWFDPDTGRAYFVDSVNYR